MLNKVGVTFWPVGARLMKVCIANTEKTLVLFMREPQVSAERCRFLFHLAKAADDSSRLDADQPTPTRLPRVQVFVFVERERRRGGGVLRLPSAGHGKKKKKSL